MIFARVGFLISEGNHVEALDMRLGGIKNYIVAHSGSLVVEGVYFSRVENNDNVSEISKKVGKKFTELGKQYIGKGGDVVVVRAANLQIVKRELPHLRWPSKRRRSVSPTLIGKKKPVRVGGELLIIQKL